jgi:hypothetical protein
MIPTALFFPPSDQFLPVRARIIIWKIHYILDLEEIQARFPPVTPHPPPASRHLAEYIRLLGQKARHLI